MSFGTYNHRFENTRLRMLGLKILEQLKIVWLSHSCEHLWEDNA